MYFVLALVSAIFAIIIIIGTTIKITAEENNLITPDSIPASGQLLAGELVGIEEDDSGVSKVMVKENDRIVYGFSTYSVSDLEYLYDVGDYVEIPVMEMKNPACDTAVNVDYMDEENKIMNS